MNDKPRIVAGLVIVLVVLTLPFWYALATTEPTARPDLELPEGHARCVRDTAYMRANHMDLLNQWRDAVVRQGDEEPVDVDGTKYPKSLSRGCMACHTSRANFCSRCHQYANVRPTCWDCHVEPPEN